VIAVLAGISAAMAVDLLQDRLDPSR
jgi:hypothetical protein